MHAATSGGDSWSQPCGTNNKITTITIYVGMVLSEAESEHTLWFFLMKIEYFIIVTDQNQYYQA